MGDSAWGGQERDWKSAGSSLWEEGWDAKKETVVTPKRQNELSQQVSGLI